MPLGRIELVKLKKGKKIMNIERIITLLFFFFETLITARFGLNQTILGRIRKREKKGFATDVCAAASMAARCVCVCQTRVQCPGAAPVLPRLGL